MESFNVIGDIAGQFKALEALVKKMPKGDLICVGDLCDRGPQSKEVYDFVMERGMILIITTN